jgi:small-conductance mechanosensitive channel
MQAYKQIGRLLRITLIALSGLIVCAPYTAGDQNPSEAGAQLDRDAILNHLNAVITWYRDATSKVQPTGLPSDAIYQDNAQTLTSEAVRLAFQSARAEASLIAGPAKQASKPAGTGKAPAGNPKANPEENPSAGAPPQQQNLAEMSAKVSAQIDEDQEKLDAVNKELATAPRSKRQALLTQRDTLAGQLSLNKAMLDAIQKMSSFVQTSTEGAAEGLQGSINEIARSVPEVLESADAKKTTNKPAATPAPAPAPGHDNSSGLIGQSLALFGQISSMHEIDQLMTETAKVRGTADALRKPLRDDLAATIQRGRDLAAQSGASTAQPQDISQEFQFLTARFKELSAATLPLSQEILVIDQARGNFLEWRKSLLEESKYTLRTLATRIILIALALAGVFVLSEIWRRLTFRYIHDPRRRRQFLVLRRFVMGFLTGIVLIMGFVSEFSSLATFAGFVTAGIAVGLQAVLLSIAAYFFVIGRYGIRVGDRISVAGVTGDVIDIGLVRLYIMELAGTGIDLYPTGRVVVFSNSVLFQAGTPLFKQIPGTEYAWHEVVIPLTPGSNYKLAQDKLFTAVNYVYEKYRASIEAQLGNIERRVEVQLKAPVLESKLQFTDAGLEFVVFYPVDIRQAAEIDDHVTRAILDVLQKEADLKAGVAGTPKIRAAIKG